MGKYFKTSVFSETVCSCASLDYNLVVGEWSY